MVLSCAPTPDSPYLRSHTWPLDPTLDMSDDEWLGIVDRVDSTPLARLEALSGVGRTFFLLTPPPTAPTPARTSTPNAETWPIDPALDLSYDEWLGIVDRIDRTPRGRMEVLTDRGRSYAVLTGWRSYPPMAAPLSSTAAAVSTPSRAVSIDAPQPTPPSARPQTLNPTPAPMRLAADDVDEGRLYTTREAAKHLGYAGDSGLRRAKALGHIMPDATGPRGVALYRRATLDAYEARRLHGNRSMAEAPTEPPAVPPSDDSSAVRPPSQAPTTETSTRGDLAGDVAPVAPQRKIQHPPCVSDDALYDRGPRSDTPRHTPSLVADVTPVLSILGQGIGLLDVAAPVAPANGAAWTTRCQTSRPPPVTARCRATCDPIDRAPTPD